MSIAKIICLGTIITLFNINCYSQNITRNNSLKTSIISKTQSPAYYLNHKKNNTHKNQIFNYINSNHSKLVLENIERKINGENKELIKGEFSIANHFVISGMMTLDIEQGRYRKNSSKFTSKYKEIDLEYQLNDKFSILYHPSTTHRSRRMTQETNQGLTLVYKL